MRNEAGHIEEEGRSREGDTGEGSGEGEDAGDDQEDDGEEAEANNATVRCSCVVCNLYLESGDIVLIPRVGYAHRACAEESFPGTNIAPRARQQPIRLVPAFNGTSHHQRDAEATRPILPLTYQQLLPPPPTRPRTTAPSGRRRGGVGQGRGPDEEPDRRAGDASRVPFFDMQGLWLALRDGRRCLVVATGISSSTREQTLLISPRGGGRRLAIPWRNGQPEADVIPGETRELAEGRLPVLRPHERPRGVWRNGVNVEAVVKVGRARYIIHREVVSDAMPVQRAQREAARAISVMEALTVIARRPIPVAQIRGREEVRAVFQPPARRPGSLGARQPSSQRGAARALFVTPTPSESTQLRALAATAGGLTVDLVTLTACPFNATGSHCWGSSWVAKHGGTQLARGSCSALTLNYSAALLAGAQEALLGLHTFLVSRGIPTNRTRVCLSISRSQEARSNAGARTELTADVLIAFYAALAGGSRL